LNPISSPSPSTSITARSTGSGTAPSWSERLCNPNSSPYCASSTGSFDAIADGLRAAVLQHRLDDLEAPKAELEVKLVAPARLHSNLAQLYPERVAELHIALADPELRTEALGLIRGLIERVEVHPAEHGFHIQLVGEIANMVTLSAGAESVGPNSGRASVKVVAGARNHRQFLAKIEI